MHENTPPSKKARFITPPNLLKQKVGFGGIDPKLVEKSQHFINTATYDFKPHAHVFLKELQDGIEGAKAAPEDIDIELLIAPVMQLKANGGMFRYQLVSDISDIALQFLEFIDRLNEDAIKVLQAHENALAAIVNSALKGDGGKEGYALVKELDSVRTRYFKKHPKRPEIKKKKRVV